MAYSVYSEAFDVPFVASIEENGAVFGEVVRVQQVPAYVHILID
jgi:hypothetical protein